MLNYAEVVGLRPVEVAAALDQRARGSGDRAVGSAETAAGTETPVANAEVTAQPANTSETSSLLKSEVRW